MIRFKMLIAILGLTLLAGCGDPTKQEIMADAEGISTKAELRAALGDPDDVAKIGPVEKWTYTASNGKVIYIITGDTVALEAGG